MEYGRVLSATTGGTLAATGIGLGYGRFIVAGVLITLVIVLNIRLFFRRSV